MVVVTHTYAKETYAPAKAWGQATKPLPRVVGLLKADLHITPVDGGRRMAVGVVLTDHSLWTLWPFPHWLFEAQHANSLCTLSRWTIHSFYFSQ